MNPIPIGTICVLATVGMAGHALRAGEAKPVGETWHCAAAPSCRLVHGWLLIEKDGESRVAREYAEGGTDMNGMKEPLDLSFGWTRTDGTLRLTIARRWKDKSAVATATPSVKKDDELHVRKLEKVTAITEAYQVLWHADVVQKDRPGRELVYVARLIPISDQVSDFDAAEMAKILDVVNKADSR